ncbi:MAG: rhomboid family intramembrane serine protease [Lachnospiraceae bacterium]|nr:rhomboid family intramembrane serine protease [Lachnospiraceae bacterium]
MWDEMKAMFSGKGFRSIELNNPAMAMYYDSDPARQLVTAIWMISDAEMHRMNRMQYQAYLSTTMKKLQTMGPYIRIISVFMTSDVDYVTLIAGQLDPRMFGYYVVNPLNTQVLVDPYQNYNNMPQLTYELRQLLEEDKAKTEAGVTVVPDWMNPVLWKQDTAHTQEEVTSWYTGRGKRITCKTTMRLIVINSVIFLFTLAAAFAGYGQNVVNIGGASGATVFGQFQLHRLITSMFLHAGIAHLGGNMIALFAFGDVVEQYLKRKKYLILYMIAGIGASLGAVLWRTITGDYELLGIGASGAIFGVMGALAVLMYTHPEIRKSSKGVPFWTIPAYLLYSIAEPVVLGALTGQESNIDFAAHIFGLIIGAVTFWYMEKKNQITQH